MKNQNRTYMLEMEIHTARGHYLVQGTRREKGGA